MKGNTVSIKGNLTKDVEVRATQSGAYALNWSIAWNQSKKNGNEWVDVPHYFDVCCWASENQLKFIQFNLIKGAQCSIIDGHLEFQSWQDNQGNNRSKVVIRVDDPISGMQVAQPVQQAQAAPTYVQQPVAQPQVTYQQTQYQQPIQQPVVQETTPSFYDEDIPF